MTRQFPANLLHAKWQTFQAEGYDKPVTGVIYRGIPHPTCGVSLGGLDTGCLDIEANGMLGYSTIFNHLINPRLILNQPLLGLSMQGQTWVLISDRQAKLYTPQHVDALPFPSMDYTPRYTEIDLQGIGIVDSIDYWGHYPLVDMEYTLSAPVQVGLRAWSPFIPGDEADSMTPGIVFEIHLHNQDDQDHCGTLGINFPGFEVKPGSENLVRRQELGGALNGILVESGIQGDAWEMAYVLAALEPLGLHPGGPLNVDGNAWAQFAGSLPMAVQGESGVSLAVDFEVGAGEDKVIRFVLAWHAPYWRAGGAPSHNETNLYHHRYARYYPDVLFTAQHLALHHMDLLKRVIAWQEVLYQDQTIPGWLADSLINNLYLIPECSIWGQAEAPIGEWCQPQDDLFALNECPRGCPQFECIPCSFYGNIPLVYFFPKAALSTLRGYKAYQFSDGRPPWIFGGATAKLPENQAPYDLSRPDIGYQTVLNGACYIIMADRYWRTSRDDSFLVEFYDSLKRCNDFSMNLRPAYGLSQVMSMPTPGTDSTNFLGDTEWFEAPEPGWKGYVTHAGGVRMAQVQIMKRMAQAMDDKPYVEKCDQWLIAGAKVLEEQLWTGKYYLNFLEPETDQRSDLIFGYQLDGQWITSWHGVPGVFPDDRVQQTLETLRLANCALSQSGAVNYTTPDGKAVRIGGYGTYAYFPPELFMLAMTYMYAGEREFGLELLYKCMKNIVEWGYLWDFTNIMRGDVDTGQRAFGADYYQNMMLWAVPAALAGGDLTVPFGENGLINRIINGQGS